MNTLTEDIAAARYTRIDRGAIDPDGNPHILRGTPTEGATFENLRGLAPLPEGWREPLWWEPASQYVLLPPCPPGFEDGRIRDRRPWAEAAEKRNREESHRGA